MKKNLLFSVVLIVALGTASAQDVIVKTYVEKTRVGVKSGTSVGMENSYGWEYGGFYQESSLLESLMSEEQKALLPRNYEKTFYGAYFAAPVMESEFVVLKAHIRTGISNGENFVITPSLLADYKISSIARFGFGLGSRAFQPTMQASFSILF